MSEGRRGRPVEVDYDPPVVEELIRRAAVGDHDAIEALSTIADEDPGRLTPYQGLLVDLDVLWPPKLCRTADAGATRRLIEQADHGCTTERLNQLLCVLAHVAHPLAEQAFRRWATQPPDCADQLYLEPLRYALEGGWILDPNGERRELCSDTAYQLVMREAPQSSGDSSCPLCSAPLWTAAEFDTAEPAVAAALAHTGWSGRLVIDLPLLCLLRDAVQPGHAGRCRHLVDRQHPPKLPGRYRAAGPAGGAGGSGTGPVEPVPGQRLERWRLNPGRAA